MTSTASAPLKHESIYLILWRWRFSSTFDLRYSIMSCQIFVALNGPVFWGFFFGGKGGLNNKTIIMRYCDNDQTQHISFIYLVLTSFSYIFQQWRDRLLDRALHYASCEGIFKFSVYSSTDLHGQPLPLFPMILSLNTIW